ncbi:MAG: bifunctional [glutamate--ammonia ligase]-adenylyl-L-tyrosine phosphorylase/[glutamate--ammonia-ligase] adenylyltransferase [Neisseriaceae bacterium]|nr:bifunctional [glutamate--ammonia ligase]-adenylyl-L-tyrosine phosphorylase/[glutamate--ammonia-ligase] adenylyltransferase [Neisseriaceae bacterium]
MSLPIAQALAQAADFSPFFTRLMHSGRLDMDALKHRLDRPLDQAFLEDYAPWASLCADENEAELKKQLRRLRQHVLAHLIVRDLALWAPLDEVTLTITQLAEFAINIGLSFAHQQQTKTYGEPIGQYSHAPQQLTVIAMGKMGGHELNVSSDIDLIFTYPEAGDTTGPKVKSNQEFFTKVGQKLIALLHDITEEGQVFRVDMRLRPNGDAGPLVLSETALEKYLITQGREWERYAWIKARVVTPGDNGLQNLVRPFVFRKYLDFDTYEAMRSLHQQIRTEVARKDKLDNIKLGAGGIREVEFIVQIFQMIRGGKVRSLQIKGTQAALMALAEHQMIEEDTKLGLLSAYRFLRMLEHRLQYVDDQQIQNLPEGADAQANIAHSMGFADYPAFLEVLNQHRQFVSHVFNDLLDTPEHGQKTTHPLALLWQPKAEEEAQEVLLLAHGFDSAIIINRIKALRQSHKYQNLSARAQPRFDALVPLLLEAASHTTQPTACALRLFDFLESIGRRSSYIAFLHEHPETLAPLARLMSHSQWMAQYIMQHPILLDELLNANIIKEQYDWAKLKESLFLSLHACGQDVEAKMDTLRHFKHAQVFRLAVQDLAEVWSIESLSDELTLLADTILEATVFHVWQSLPKKHRDTPRFAIIGYGKLGGKELSYTSDLDLVFVFQDDHPDALELYSRAVQRITNWLSSTTGAGSLYQIDLRLRPNGDAGMPCVSLDAFVRYQEQDAWTWEHQALTRARFVCGDAAVGQAVERLRHDVLTRPRNIQALRREIITMREKMFATHPPLLDNVKYARGGVVDVEFLVQYLILEHAHNHPHLTRNYGNIALLAMAADAGLIDPKMATAARLAYRYYRSVQHDSHLRDRPMAQVDDVLLGHYAAVKRLWQAVLAQDLA